MRPTIRGWAVLAIALAAIWMGWEYGARSLDAVVVPLAVVLIAGVIAVGRADRPESRYAPVADGFVGERRTIELTIESTAAVSATVRDTVGDGLTLLESDSAGTAGVDDGDPVVETTLRSDNRIAYDVRLEERGEHRLGPATITVTDVFGLVKKRVTAETTATALVYPPIRTLRPGSEGERWMGTDAIENRNRETFDHLREYQRGDSLRDVHWKSAAKRPDDDLVVTEYATDEETGTTTIAAECTPSRDDELATAVASVATHLLEAGVDVGVVLPADEHEPGAGQDHHYDLLAALARLEAGELDDHRREPSDVLIQADANGTRIVVDDRTVPFDQLLADRERSTSAPDAGETTDRTARGRAADGAGESEVHS